MAGDANYVGDSSDCENFTVNKAQPSILTTQDPASGSVGDTYNDTATLSDGVMLDGTGSITFTLYDAAGCDGNVIDTETVDNISANGDLLDANRSEAGQRGHLLLGCFVQR